MISVDIKATGDVDAMKRSILVNPAERIRLFVEHGTHTSPSGFQMDNVELAHILTYGAFGIPSRPFFSDFVREEAELIREILKANIHVEPRTSGQRKDRVSINYSRASAAVLVAFKTWLAEGSYYKAVAPNSELTIAVKGHDTPLIDQGSLLEAINVKVVYKRKEKRV